LAPGSDSDELQAGQGIHRDGIRLDVGGHIANDQIGVAALQQDAGALGESREVATRDRIADDQDDRARFVWRSKRVQ